MNNYEYLLEYMCSKCISTMHCKKDEIRCLGYRRLEELINKSNVLDKALDWACQIISKDCHVMDFDGDERMVCGNAETWKEYLLNEIEKEEKMTG